MAFAPTALRNAIASSSRSGADLASNYLVIGGVPKTALPRDVLLALQKIGAAEATIAKSITVEDVIKQPPSAPLSGTNPSNLDAAFHITFPTIEQARVARRQIVSRGLFFSFHRRPTKERSGGDPSLTGRRAMVVVNTRSSGQAWYTEQMNALLSGGWKGENDPRASSSSSSEVIRLVQEKRIAPLDQRLRGKQVWLQGLPLTTQDQGVRNSLSDFQISDLDGVVALPVNGAAHHSFIVTLPSVSEAHRLVRKLHMKPWGKEYDHSGKRNPLVRAQVVW